MNPRLVLASSSTYRKAQLAQLCADFICLSPDIDETPRQSELPEQLSTRLALEKAQGVISQAPENALIIGADQCASLNGKILGKPLNQENARLQLSSCSGQTLIFYSGLCVLNKKSQAFKLDCIKTEVTFRRLSSEEIAAYIKKEDVLGCAGSFKCEGLGISLFDKISSDDPSALIGLPLIQLNRFLLEFGMNTLLG